MGVIHVYTAGWRGLIDHKINSNPTTTQDCAKEGFPQDAIDASVNSIEFSLREFNTGSFPRGLSFMLGAMGQWIYDRDPLDGLRFEQPLQELKVCGVV